MKSSCIYSLLVIAVLFGFAVLTLKICPVDAQPQTVYIRANGDVEPSWVPIQRNGDVYTFTGDIIVDGDATGIIIERDNMTLDGAGYLFSRFSSISYAIGIEIVGRVNVTINGMRVTGFSTGIWLDASNKSTIFGNTVTNNDLGIGVGWVQGESSNNTISQNIIAFNQDGIYLLSNNIGIHGNSLFNNSNLAIDFAGALSGILIIGNDISNNTYGIDLVGANNIIEENNITNNYGGIGISDSNSKIFHNNFINNTNHIYWVYPGTSNVWDDGYPSGGNYWDDYSEKYPHATEMEESGLWDTPYVIDEVNQDSYPLVETIPEFPSLIILPLFVTLTLVGAFLFNRRSFD